MVAFSKSFSLLLFLLFSVNLIGQNNISWYQVIGTKIYEVDFSNENFSKKFTGVDLPERSATIAFNPLDEALYSITDDNKLYRISKNRQVDLVTKIKTDKGDFFTTAAFDENGNLFLNAMGNGEFVVLEIENDKIVDSYNLQMKYPKNEEREAYTFFDMEYNLKTNRFNAIDINGILISINPKNGKVKQVLNTSLTTGTRGSIWFMEDFKIASFENSQNNYSIYNKKSDTWKKVSTNSAKRVDWNDGATYFNSYFEESEEVSYEASSSQRKIENLENDIAIIPNPTKRDFSIQLNSKLAEDATIQILDLKGAVLYTQAFPKIAQSLFIENIDLPKGAYLVKVFNQNAVYKEKLLIQ